MKQLSICLITVGAMFLGLWHLNGQEKKPPKKGGATLMQRKLAASEKLLPALADEDFEKLGKTADQLLKLAKEEWVQEPSAEYQAQLKDFWIVLEGLKTSADEKNLDGATLGYVQMTISCVKCHKYIRKQAQ